MRRFGTRGRARYAETLNATKNPGAGKPKAKAKAKPAPKADPTEGKRKPELLKLARKMGIPNVRSRMKIEDLRAAIRAAVQ